METVRKGDWVRIRRDVLEPHQRAPKLPEETRQVPLVMWVTGALLEDNVSLGDAVAVQTVTGRVVRGLLEAVHPSYKHSFGVFVPELHAIRRELGDLMREGGADDRES